jgi:O-antigen biosynthesis protein
MIDDESAHPALAQLASERLLRATGLPPQISIITPVWNTKTFWLEELAASILRQTTSAWEWCIVDDCSSDTSFYQVLEQLKDLPGVKLLRLEEPHGISRASNRGLELATAPYVCFVDHDDLLAPDALSSTLEKHEEGFDAVYSDSDKVNEQGEHSEPFHKPGWSPDLFRGVMYVGHLLSVSRELALKVGGFDSRFDGVQDFEFFLRCAELTSRIGHVPKILYHWRKVPGSVAASADAKGDVGKLQAAAVQAHLERIGLHADALPGAYPHRVRVAPRMRTEWPRISIIIPTKDSPDVLSACLYSLFSKTTYPDFEVLCIDNETVDRRALEEMSRAPVTRIVFSGKFNFSKANNVGCRFATGSYFVFLNNDIEVITPDWLEQMLFYAEQQDIGAVGSLLLYPDRRVQHAGVVLGCRGTADHVSRFAPENSDGYAGSLSCAREVSAVTAACLMTRRDVFEGVAGFNEHFFTAYQDVDLCLKIRRSGKRIIFNPHVKMIHHESLSRGSYYDFVDRNLLLDYWEPMIKAGDPYYNVNFDVQACDYSAAVR